MAKSSARMRKAKRTGAFIETTHLDCFQRAERGGCERCGPRACAKFTVVHTADEATDPSVMAFCSICGKCVYFFIFFVWRDVYGQLVYIYDAVFCFICSQVAITSRTRPRLGGGWRRPRRSARTARGSSAPEPRGTRRGKGRRGRRRRWTSRIESHLSHSGSTLIQMQTEGIMRMRDTRRGSSIARTGAARCVGTPTSSRTRPRRRDGTRRGGSWRLRRRTDDCSPRRRTREAWVTLLSFFFVNK